MTYEITPAHFGFTTRLRVLSALGTLAHPSWAWTPREIVTGQPLQPEARRKVAEFEAVEAG